MVGNGRWDYRGSAPRRSGRSLPWHPRPGSIANAKRPWSADLRLWASEFYRHARSRVGTPLGRLLYTPNGGRLTRRLLTAVAVLFASSFAAPAGHAQTFKVEKFDIKGDGGTDYVAAEAATGRVFVSRGTHMMVVEGATGKVLGDIPNTPGVHGAGIATKAGHGFTTNGGDDSTFMEF